MAEKVAAILQKTSGTVGVLEGWGGMFMLELIPAGICGSCRVLGLAISLHAYFVSRKMEIAIMPMNSFREFFLKSFFACKTSSCITTRKSFFSKRAA